MSEQFLPPKLHVNVAEKSDTLSIHFRNHGNEHYQLKLFSSSLLCYNKSITYAKSKEVISLAYANRSAIYSELNLYDECIKNIKWARENGYPQSKMYKLNEREEKCKKSINSNVKPDSSILDNFKLSYPASKTIPFMADCIEMNRHDLKIITKRDLKAGDVISLEDPVINFLRKDGLYKYCSNCYESCLMNLIPCSRTASMMFCSTSCMTTFYSKALNINEILCDDVKLLSEMSAAFGGIGEFKTFITKYMSNSNSKQFNQTIFDYDFSNPKHPDYNKNRMKCVLALSKGYSYSIDENTCNSKKYVSKKVTDRILGILMPNLPRSAFLYPPSPFEKAVIPLFASILKQSCLPNVFTCNISNQVVTIVLKPIKKGEELHYSHFNNYGFALKDHPHEAAIILNYKCNCQVCMDDNYTFFPPEDFRGLHPMSIAESLACIKEAWNYINAKTRNVKDMCYHVTKIRHALAQIFLHYEFPFSKNTILY